MLVFQRGLVEHSLYAVQCAMKKIMAAEVRELLSNCKYGKKDTLELDALPEIIFDNAIKAYHSRAVFVTEETDKQTIARMPANYHPDAQPIVFIADPIDRSKFFKRFILHLFFKKTGSEDYSESDLTIGDLWKEFDVIKEWEELLKEPPAEITGATTALTCIVEGRAVCSVIGNVITGNIVLACDLGVYLVNLKKVATNRIWLDDICSTSTKIYFPGPSADNSDILKKFVTFTGKDGYREHFEASKIILGKNGMDRYLYHREPGGPSRAAYLSSLNSGCPEVGFILYNGEKITEWCHALPIVKNAKDGEGKPLLRIFEVFTDPIMAKNDIAMSNAPDVSIFYDCPSIGKFMNINRIGQFRNPSHYRLMLIICHRDNIWLTTVMTKKCFREISEFF